MATAKKTYTEYLSGLYRPPPGLKDPAGFICLNHNEAPFGPGDLLKLDLSDLNLYPEPYFLYQRLAEYYQLKPTQLLLTCGSEQGLRFVFDTYLDYGSKVVHPYPTFGMVEVFTYLRKAQVCRLTYDQSLHIELEKIISAIDGETRLFYLANSDNPTGSCYSIEEIKAVAARCLATGTIFLLDEAYFPYYEIPTLPLLKKYPNLIIVRSFSKAWGLAGARAGFIIANPEVITLLRKQKPMDELNSLSIQLCLQALERPVIMQRNLAQVAKWKNRFRLMQTAEKPYIECGGNFIMLKSKNHAKDFALLKENKILPRIFKEECLRNCIRFSVSTDEIMQKIACLLYPGYPDSKNSL